MLPLLLLLLLGSHLALRKQAICCCIGEHTADVRPPSRRLPQWGPMIFTLGLAIALSVGAQTASKTFSVRVLPVYAGAAKPC